MTQRERDSYFFKYDIANGKIDDSEEIDGIGIGFREFRGQIDEVRSIFYKGGKGNVTEVICETFDKNGAEEGVNKFLAFMHGKNP
jgi:hypothetical protein